MSQEERDMERIMGRDAKIFPDVLKAEIKVQVDLPPEARALLTDLHNDRQFIGIGGFIMTVCTIIMAYCALRGQRSHS